jgi:hypothetical protein
MHLELSEEDAVTLRSLLHNYLPDLRREVAGTDARELRHELAKRQDLCERLLDRLGDGPEAPVWDVRTERDT